MKRIHGGQGGKMTRPTVNGQCGTLGSISLYSGSRVDLGSCNFCTSATDDQYVTEIKGYSLAVRVCDTCLRTIKDYTRVLVPVFPPGTAPASNYIRVGDCFSLVHVLRNSKLLQCLYDVEGDIQLIKPRKLLISGVEYDIQERIRLNSSNLYCFYSEESIHGLG